MVVKRVSVDVRNAIQESTLSIRTLAHQYGVSPTTIHKWKGRHSAQEHRSGPKTPHSTTLTAGEEQLIILFRSQTLLPLDDCLYALKPAVPAITRSSMHRCFQRHGLTPLSNLSGLMPRPPDWRKSADIGFFHLSVIRVEQTDGAGLLFIALDRVTKFGYSTFLCRDVAESVLLFIKKLVEAVPYEVREVILHLDVYCSIANSPAGGRQNVEMQKHSLSNVARKFKAGRFRPSNADMETIDLISQRIASLAPTKGPLKSCRQFKKYVEELAEKYNHSRKLKSLGGHTPFEYIKMIGH